MGKKYDHLSVEERALIQAKLECRCSVRATPALADLVVLQKGSRLSITPVDAAH